MVRKAGRAHDQGFAGEAMSGAFNGAIMPQLRKHAFLWNHINFKRDSGKPRHARGWEEPNLLISNPAWVPDLEYHFILFQNLC